MARRLRITKRTPLWVVLLLLVISIGQYHNWWQPVKQAAIVNQPGLYKVVKGVDGDTIIVDMNGKQEKIRMIGVDTPETHDPRKTVQCFGQAAAGFTKQTLEGKVVRLESDSLSTNRDRYDRLLRYVYTQDGVLFNEDLIKNGYGFAYTSFPFTKKDQFLAGEKAAQATKAGLWGTCTPSKNQYGGYTSNNAN